LRRRDLPAHKEEEYKKKAGKKERKTKRKISPEERAARKTNKRGKEKQSTGKKRNQRLLMGKRRKKNCKKEKGGLRKLEKKKNLGSPYRVLKRRWTNGKGGLLIPTSKRKRGWEASEKINKNLITDKRKKKKCQFFDWYIEKGGEGESPGGEKKRKKREKRRE